MKFLILTLLALAVLSALAAVIYTIRERKRSQRPSVDLSRDAYGKALARWQHDYAKGTDKRPDFPTFPEWELEEQWKYYDEHGHWPGQADHD